MNRPQRRSLAEAALSLLLRLYPSAFREVLAADLLHCFRSEERRVRRERGRWAALTFSLRNLAGALAGALPEWFRPRARRLAARQSCGTRWKMASLDAIRIEAAHSRRSLLRSPGFVVACVVTLGLGIGANVAMFELVDQLLLRPPAHLQHPEEVRRIHHARTRNANRFSTGSFSYPAFAAIASVPGLETVAGTAAREAIAELGGGPRKLRVLAASASYWDLFDASPVLGRFFDRDDDRVAAGEPVAVLSHALWRSAFGAEPDVLGRPLRLGGRRFTIVGVAPQGFRGLDLSSPEVFLPLAAAGTVFAGDGFESSAGTTWVSVVARIPEGAGTTAVGGVTAALNRHYAEHAGEAATREMAIGTSLEPLLRDRGPDPRVGSRIALWLLGMSAVMVLVACANVATLMLGRALERRREAAVRTALGVSRARLFLGPLLESLMLAALVALAAVPIGHAAVRFLSRMLLPEVADAVSSLSGRSLAYGIAVVLVAGVAAALVPAVHTMRSDLSSLLRRGGSRAGRVRSRAQAALPMVQAALSAVLLVGAGLFVRSLWEVRDLDLGFDAERVITAGAETHGAFDMFEPDDGAFGFSMEVLRDRAAALPGVERAALAAGTPFGNLMNSILVLPGGEGPDVGTVESNLVDPDYFAALGTRILEGRGFGNMDVTGAPPVMIVSQTLARKLWPGESALGKCAHPGEPSSPCLEVVGVAQDVRGRDMAEEQLLQYYRPRSQEDRKIRETLVLRVALPPDRILPSLRRELQAMLPASVFLEIQPLHAGLQGQTRNWRVGARVFGAFGGMALAMAAIGLFSVVAYDVRQRRGEFGVRMAFGARPVDLIRLVVAGGLRLAGVGVIAGLLVAAALVGRLGELLFRVEPLDPLTFLGVGAILLASAVVASWVATSGACRTEVTAVLRSE